MKEIDFLPASFHQARIRRIRTQRNLRFSLVLIAAFGALHLAGATRLRGLETALASYQAGEGDRLCQQARLASLRARRQNVARESALVSQLDDDVPLDAMVAEIHRLMTDSMALRSLEVVRSAAPPEKGPDGTEKKPDPVLSHGPTSASLTGVAASDVEVGMFYGRLASCLLFGDVRLSFSREVEQSGRQMREFEIRMAVRRVALPQG